MSRFILALAMICIATASFSQEKNTPPLVNVIGLVTDSTNSPLSSVSVTIKGQNRGGTTTDQNGKFVIAVPASSVLTFSYTGFLSVDMAVDGRKELSVKLERNIVKAGDEVVVVGYGTQKKSATVGSVVSVDPRELKGPTSNLTTMLAGRIPGIISFQQSGEPGKDNASFFVRGVGSFGAGKVDPLILIDGIESDATGLARLQPDDIAGFSVLKDATSSAVYGARGANGVILVTTKRGSYNKKTTFTARTESSVSSNTRNFKLADNIDYMNLANEAILTRNPLDAAPYSQSKIDHTIAGDDPLLYPNNNWLKMMIKDYTVNNRYDVNAEGGTEKVSYYLSMTYNVDNGILKNVGNTAAGNTNIKLASYSLLSNTTINVTPTTKVLVSMRGQFDNSTGPIGGGAAIFNSVLQTNPVAFAPVYPASYIPYAKHPLFGNSIVPNTTTSLWYNPLAETVSGYEQDNASTLTAQLEVTQNLKFITKGLSTQLMAYITRYSTFTLNRNYNPFFYAPLGTDTKNPQLTLLNDPSGVIQISPSPTEYLSYSPGDKTLNSKTYVQESINYQRLFGDKHEINGMVIGILSDYQTANAADLQSSLPSRNLGVSGRLTYTYDNRFLLETNFGYNGSERFAANNRVGFFPSIGGAYIVSNENYFARLNKTITNLKFRVSYGLVGNDQIGNPSDRFFYLSNVNLNDASKGYSFGTYALGGGTAFYRPGVTTTRYENPDITWERSQQTNLGMDLQLFSKLNVTADVYLNKRSDILMQRSTLPSTLGLQATPSANTGKASSKGIDLAIDYTANLPDRMYLQVRSTFTYAASKLINDEEPVYPNGLQYLSHTGHSINQTFGLVAERLFLDDNEVANSPAQNFGSVVRAGDIKYRDLNKDGIISNLDQVPIGYPTVPEINYGFGFTLGYHDFDISAFFQGSARSSIFVNPDAINPFEQFTTGRYGLTAQSGLLDVIAKSHWSESNQNLYAFWPRLSKSQEWNDFQTSNWWMRNGGFIRMKNAELGYNFSKRLNKQLHFSSGRFYVNASNLFAISQFNLWDPEMGGNGLGYPVQRVFNIGLRLGLQ
jgi:TonB-linked SusC/RagA family outer membrane protein